MNRPNSLLAGLLIVYFSLTSIDVATNTTKSVLLLYVILAVVTFCVFFLAVQNKEKKQINVSNVDVLWTEAAVFSLSYILCEKSNMIRYFAPGVFLLLIMLIGTKYKTQSENRFTKVSFITTVVFVICLLLFADK